MSIVSNQENEKYESNKEEEIINNGGETTTDELSSIKLIDKQQYNALSDDDKKEYVKYNPSLTSQVYVQYLNTQNQLIEYYNQMCGLISKMPDIDNLSNINSFLEPIKSIADTVSTIMDTIKTLLKTLNELGLGELGNVLTGILKLIGALAAMLYLMLRNPYLVMKEYYEAFKSVDINAIKEYFEGDTTPNLEEQTVKVNNIIIPDEEIKTYVTNNTNKISDKLKKISEAIKSIEILEQTSKMAENIQNTMDTITISMANAASGIAEMAKQQVIDSYNNAYDEHKDDYKTNSLEVASNVNNFIHNLPQKYIKATDLEILKRIEKEKS